MIGLDTYFQTLASTWQKKFERLQGFQHWMQGKGFDAEVGGVQAGSAVVRSLEKHARSRPGRQEIIAIGSPAGDPSTIVTLHAIVSRITEDGGKSRYKAVYGIGFLARHIIVLRHVRLVMGVRDARRYRRDKAAHQEVEAEVKDMLADL